MEHKKFAKMFEMVAEAYYSESPSSITKELWGDMPPMTPERQAEIEAYQAKMQAIADEQKRLWESLPGKTLASAEREDDMRLTLTFTDGTTVKMEAYVSEDGELDVEIEEL
jgi:hypothetical protein